MNNISFEIEPELLAPTPRRVVATNSTIIAWRLSWNFLLLLICLITASSRTKAGTLQSGWTDYKLWIVIPYLVLMWLAKKYGETRQKFLRCGEARVATVLSRRISAGGKNGDALSLHYSYIPDGKRRLSQVVVSKPLFDVFTEGSKFSVLVSAANVNRCKPYFAFSDFRLEDAPKRTWP